MRILTSGYLQSNADFYQAFVEGGRTIKEYCSQVRYTYVLASIKIISQMSYPASQLSTSFSGGNSVCVVGGGAAMT